jgi:hypothetical protein
MMMLKFRSDTEVRFRSLLQKAVRRGHVDLVYTTSALLESLNAKVKNWYRTRTAIITFEECWPLGRELIFNRKFYSKVAALIKVTQNLKSKDASGLGYLAYALHEGDTSVLDGTPEDKHIKIVANAIRRPDDFWHWAESQEKSEEQTALVENAAHFKQEGMPRDRAVIQAVSCNPRIRFFLSGLPLTDTRPRESWCCGMLPETCTSHCPNWSGPVFILKAPKQTVKFPQNGGTGMANGAFKKWACRPKKHIFSGIRPSLR